MTGEDGAVQYGFNYRLTFQGYKNPPSRYREIGDRLKDWFKSNAINWGMGSLGGSRVVYGDIQGPSESYLTSVREELTKWLSTLPMCCSVELGVTKSLDALDLLNKDCECHFEVDNLTEGDRREAQEYETGLARWANTLERRAGGGSA
jgi:hypothetical protein